jgi:inner membrane protein involved in colicin E2 resistance
MIKRVGPLALIFIFASIAWMILGGSAQIRTHTQDSKLRDEVGELWGTSQKQDAPRAFYRNIVVKEMRADGPGETGVRKIREYEDYPVILEANNIDVSLKLEHRKKGLLWYSTYRVQFAGVYTLKNQTGKSHEFLLEYSFPTENGIYDDFSVSVDGEEMEEISPVSGKVKVSLDLDSGESKSVRIAYGSQGMDEWWYSFGDGVSQIKNFKLAMTTDFDDIDFPENGIAPTSKEKSGDGWRLTWDYSNLISGIQIGMKTPGKLNPGPFVSRVSFFAPVSLFLFFFLIFIITTVRKIDIHPMNYFFIAASFFSFHLLLAYLVDHIGLHFAFAISSLVSIFLVISYMRLVIGLRFAFVEIGLSQLVYLVLFSWAFFLKGFTGLAITICCIITLFVVMQFTARFKWEGA